MITGTTSVLAGCGDSTSQNIEAIASKIYGYEVTRCQTSKTIDRLAPTAKAVCDCMSEGADGYFVVELQNGRFVSGNGNLIEGRADVHLAILELHR